MPPRHRRAETPSAHFSPDTVVGRAPEKYNDRMETETVNETAKETKKEKRRAALIAADCGDRDIDRSLAELRALAESADMEVVLEVSQRRDAPDGRAYLGAGRLDYVLVNSGALRPALVEKYKAEGKSPVVLREREALTRKGIKIVERDFTSETDYIRHDPRKLARTVEDFASGWVK